MPLYFFVSHSLFLFDIGWKQYQNGISMSNEKEKTHGNGPGKGISTATAVRAVSTLAVVVLPLAATVGAILGYGAYSILKRLRKTGS